MQCNSILIPCNLSEIEILATIEFVKMLDSLKKLQGSGSPHLIIIPNKVPPKQVHINQLVDALSEVDVVIGPTISDLAIFKNDLKGLSKKISNLPQSYKSQYMGFRDFIYKVLVKRQIDKLIAGENETHNVSVKQKTLYLSLKTIKSLNLFKQTACKPEKIFMKTSKL